MARTAYRRKRPFVEDMIVSTRHLENGDETGLSPRRRAIVRGLRQHATPRQRQELYLYYAQGLNLARIAKLLKLDISTVSRTIQRGEDHARQALALLNENDSLS